MKKGLAMLMAVILAISLVGAAMGDEKSMTEQEWYSQALLDSEMSLGNNARLKNVIERAQQGEEITLAVIGGSITEGAGASQYRECWAQRFGVRFGNTYGAENGSHVHLVNAGVGGTPSTFGYMRYARDVVSKVPAEDPDGLPDVVVIEFSVNDWGEPTNHRCFESMVREILDAPNEPAVILLFAVFKTGFNLQDDLRKIGDSYGLMMVSVKDAVYSRIGKDLTEKEFFFDDYHPTSLGHRIMADCLMKTIADAAEKETDVPQNLDVPAVYGTDFIGLKTIYGDTESGDFTVERGGFPGWDTNSYHNLPVGWVCGKNFYHDAGDSAEPLKVTGTFRKCLVAWKAASDASFGAAEILMDGKTVMTVQGAPDKWGQSEVVLVLDDQEAAEHVLEIRVKDPEKRFTVTAIGLQ